MDKTEIQELYNGTIKENPNIVGENLYNLFINKVSQETQQQDSTELYNNFMDGGKRPLLEDPLKTAKNIFIKNYRNNETYQILILDNTKDELSYQQIEALRPMDHNNQYFCRLIESIGVEKFLQFPVEKINAIKAGYYYLINKEGDKNLEETKQKNATKEMWNMTLLALGESIVKFSNSQIEGLQRKDEGLAAGFIKDHCLGTCTIKNFGGEILSQLSKEQLQALVISEHKKDLGDSKRDNFILGVPNNLDEKIINLSPEQIVAYYYQYEGLYSFDKRERTIRDEKIEIEKISAEEIKELGKIK